MQYCNLLFSSWLVAGLIARVDADTAIEGTTVKLSDEESFSNDIPVQHRCNTCKAIVFQLNEHFKKLGPHSFKLQEYEVEDVYSTVCEGKNTLWQKYGARDIEGSPALTGPGLHDPAPEPGKLVATSTGGIWADRLQRACLHMVEDIGEWELYKMYKKDGRKNRNIDEQEVCVKRRKACTVQELDRINTKVLQDVQNNDKKVQSASLSTDKGFSTKEAAQVTKSATSVKPTKADEPKLGKTDKKQEGKAQKKHRDTKKVGGSSPVEHSAKAAKALQGGETGKQADLTEGTKIAEATKPALTEDSEIERRKNVLDQIVETAYNTKSLSALQEVLDLLTHLKKKEKVEL